MAIKAVFIGEGASEEMYKAAQGGFYNYVEMRPYRGERVSNYALRLGREIKRCDNKIPMVVAYPEIGLYGFWLGFIAGLLQIIESDVYVCTQSPQMLSNLVGIDFTLIRLCEQTMTTPNIANIWLERYTMGQLWSMGQLGECSPLPSEYYTFVEEEL